MDTASNARSFIDAVTICLVECDVDGNDVASYPFPQALPTPDFAALVTARARQLGWEVVVSNGCIIATRLSGARTRG